jgi:hypothetical protein
MASIDFNIFDTNCIGHKFHLYQFPSLTRFTKKPYYAFYLTMLFFNLLKVSVVSILT